MNTFSCNISKDVARKSTQWKTTFWLAMKRNSRCWLRRPRNFVTAPLFTKCRAIQLMLINRQLLLFTRLTNYTTFKASGSSLRRREMKQIVKREKSKWTAMLLPHSPEDLFSGTAALFLASTTSSSSLSSFSRSLSLFREDRDGEQVCDRLFLAVRMEESSLLKRMWQCSALQKNKTTRTKVIDGGGINFSSRWWRKGIGEKGLCLVSSYSWFVCLYIKIQPE